MNKNLLFISLLIAGLLSACSEGAVQDIKTHRPPNIVLIFTDDQGYQDVGVFGAQGFTTPHLDQMASEGIVLTDYYATQAVCSASRASILTGCYANRLNIHYALMPDSNIGLDPDETTLAEMLKSQGYTTGIFGKWHLGNKAQFMPNNHGFDEFFGIPYSNDMWPQNKSIGYEFDPLPLYHNIKVIDTLEDQTSLTTQITERSVAFINEHYDKPFFLYVPHPQPHVPLFVSEKFRGKSEKGLYGDVIMEIDWSVGQILKALKENDIDGHTMVIFTSDNGPWLAYGNHAGSALPLREGKTTTWEGGQREPFIVRYPGKLPQGKKISKPVMAIDILPTIAEITGAQLPSKKIDGKSAWSLWTGTSDASPQEAYFYYYAKNELRAVRYGKWKLHFPHSYRSVEKRTLGKDGERGNYINIKLEEIALYDLSNDMSESHNVAKSYPEVVKTIQAIADQMRSELGDALTGVEGTGNRAAATAEY